MTIPTDGAVPATAAPAPDPASPAVLSRRLGVLHLSIAGTGTILGAGIYVLVGAAAGDAGGLVWLSFVIAAAAAALTGLSYAELASMFPRAGAGYEYARQAFGPRVALFTGWQLVTAGIVATAAVALGFGGYLAELAGSDAQIGALALLAVSAAIAASGVLGSVSLAGVLTAVEADGLVLVSALGLVDFEASELVRAGSAAGVLSGAALVFFAYIGFEDIATFAEEVRNPEKAVPRALLIAIGVATALYVLVSVVAVGAVGAAALAGSAAPLALVAQSVLGSGAGDVLAMIALAATANTVLLLLMASSRRIFGMASAGALPPVFASIHPRTRVPLRSLVAVVLVAAAVTFIDDIHTVADTTNFPLLLGFMVINAAVIALRRRPRRDGGFRTPGSLPLPGGRTVALTPVLAIGLSALLLTRLDGMAILGGCVITAGGLAAAAIFGGRAAGAVPPA